MPMSEEKCIALLSTTAITSLADATTDSGETTIYTVPPLKTCILAFAWLRTSANCGTDGVFSIGQNGAETDFVGLTSSANLDAASDVIIMAPVPSATPATLKEYAAGVVIKFDVATAAAASAGTLYLFGLLDDED